MGFPLSTYTLDPLKLESLPHGSAVRAYFVELSTFQQQPLLGSYDRGKLCLNDCGQIVAEEWVRLATNRKGVDLDLWMITPASLKSILFLRESTESATPILDAAASQKPWLLSSFITSFKAATAKRINLCRNQPGQSVWQRNYDQLLIADPMRLSHLRHQLDEVADEV
jgi:putative transposase